MRCYVFLSDEFHSHVTHIAWFLDGRTSTCILINCISPYIDIHVTSVIPTMVNRNLHESLESSRDSKILNIVSRSHVRIRSSIVSDPSIKDHTHLINSCLGIMDLSVKYHPIMYVVYSILL